MTDDTNTPATPATPASPSDQMPIATNSGSDTGDTFYDDLLAQIKSLLPSIFNFFKVLFSTIKTEIVASYGLAMRSSVVELIAGLVLAYIFASLAPLLIIAYLGYRVYQAYTK